MKDGRLILVAEWDDEEEARDNIQQWEDDWDDDDVGDDFTAQLRAELAKHSTEQPMQER